MKIRLAILVSAAAMMAIPASGQDANIEGRVNKLEKEMKAVQRVAFPNCAGQFTTPDIATPDATNKTNATSTTAVSDLLTRVDALESQLAKLTNQVEQQGNQTRSLETRLKALEAEAAKPAVAAVTPDPAPTKVTAATPAAAKPKPATTTPAAKPSATRTAAVAAIEKPASGDAFNDSYDYGYRLWSAKFYPEAQVQLQETVDKHGKHARASFARNLLGRAWLDDKKPATAVKIFYDNYKNDPRGGRAPESLYYLGVALTDLGKNAEACEAFGQLTSAYPGEASGRLASQISSGRTRAKCK